MYPRKLMKLLSNTKGASHRGLVSYLYTYSGIEVVGCLLFQEWRIISVYYNMDSIDTPTLPSTCNWNEFR